MRCWGSRKGEVRMSKAYRTSRAYRIYRLPQIQVFALTTLTLLVILGCKAPDTSKEINPLQSIDAPSKSMEESSVNQKHSSEAFDDLSGKEIIMKTDDGISLSGTIYHSSAPRGILLLPMLGHERSSFHPIISELSKDYAVLALDLRGHGKSQGTLSSFGSADFQNMKLDVKAAIQALGKKETAIIGASIGANLALTYAAGDLSIKSVVLLSPGIEYKTIETSNVMKAFSRPVMMVASKKDAYSFESVKQLSSLKPSASAEYYEGDKHGTDIFSSGAVLQLHILNWIKTTLPPHT